MGVPTAEKLEARGAVRDAPPRPPKLPTGVAPPDLSPPAPLPLPLPPRATPQNSLPLALASASPTGRASEPRCSQTRARRSGTANDPIMAPDAEGGEAAAESERELVVDEAGECATAVAEEAVAETELKTSP